MVIAGDPRRSVVQVHGELDAATAPDLAQYLDAVIAVHPGDVVLDLAELQLMDSTGVQVILDGLARLRAAGRDLVLREPSPPVRKTLEACGVCCVLAIDDGHAT